METEHEHEIIPDWVPVCEECGKPVELADITDAIEDGAGRKIGEYWVHVGG